MMFDRWCVVSRRLELKRPGVKIRNRWLCKCKCGTQRVIREDQLKSGETRSCGCLQRELMSKRFRTHGLSESLTFKSWTNMWSRCTSPRYKRYHGRGIQVDAKWTSFEQFLKDMGPRPSVQYSIERRDNNGHYCKSNCYWATKVEQAGNTSKTRLFTFQGKSKTLPQWSRDLDIKLSTLRGRWRKGWTVDAIFTTPIQENQWTHRTWITTRQ